MIDFFVFPLYKAKRGEKRNIVWRQQKSIHHRKTFRSNELIAGQKASLLSSVCVCVAVTVCKTVLCNSVWKTWSPLAGELGSSSSFFFPYQYFLHWKTRYKITDCRSAKIWLKCIKWSAKVKALLWFLLDQSIHFLDSPKGRSSNKIAGNDVKLFVKLLWEN